MNQFGLIVTKISVNSNVMNQFGLIVTDKYIQ